MAERGGVKLDCISLVSVEIPHVTNHVLKRRRPYRSDDIEWYMNALIDHPEILTALGGIPDQLKIKDCRLFRGLSSVKVPTHLPEGPTEYYKALRIVINKILLENDADQASEKTSGVSCSSICKLQPTMYTDKLGPLRYLLDEINEQLMEEEEEEEQPNTMNNIDQQLNVAANLVHLNPSTKQAARKESDESVERNYTYCSFSSGAVQFLRRDCGDFYEIVYLKAVLVNKPGVVFAIGGIPDELKITDGISFSFPFPNFKIPKKLPPDPTLRKKVLSMVFNNAGKKFGIAKFFFQAYEKAVGISSSSISELSEKEEKAKEKTQNIDQVPHTMVEVNLAGPI